MYSTTVALNPTYFIGMDLHSNNVVVCVLQNAANQDGQLIKKVIKRKKIALSTGLKNCSTSLNLTAIRNTRLPSNQPITGTTLLISLSVTDGI